MDKLGEFLRLPLFKTGAGRLGVQAVAVMVSPVVARCMEEARKKAAETKHATAGRKP